MIFGSSITSTVLVVLVLNLVFNHWRRHQPEEYAVQRAVDEGAVFPESSFGEAADAVSGRIPRPATEARRVATAGQLAADRVRPSGMPQPGWPQEEGTGGRGRVWLDAGVT